MIDACNIRYYCMPAVGVQFLPREHLLSFDHIERFVRTAVALGISKVRLTGEESLRPELHSLVARLRAIDGLQHRPDDQRHALDTKSTRWCRRVCKRINISLDTLSEPTFRQLTRREGLDRVLAGIEATRRFPQLELRLNSLVLKDVNSTISTIWSISAAATVCTLRFIEFMPLDSDRQWSQARMVLGETSCEACWRSVSALSTRR
ncbi:MAG: radical SAM protein [Pirellulaceae bacterium]